MRAGCEHRTDTYTPELCVYVGMQNAAVCALSGGIFQARGSVSLPGCAGAGQLLRFVPLLRSLRKKKGSGKMHT